MHRATTKRDCHVGLDKTVPSHTSARTPFVYVDGYHVALEEPREGIRSEIPSRVASNIPEFQNRRSTYGIELHRDTRWLKAFRL
jgi:hypothetical protein